MESFGELINHSQHFVEDSLRRGFLRRLSYQEGTVVWVNIWWVYGLADVDLLWMETEPNKSYHIPRWNDFPGTSMFPPRAISRWKRYTQNEDPFAAAFGYGKRSESYWLCTTGMQLLQNLPRTLSGRKSLVFSYHYDPVCFQHFGSQRWKSFRP